MLLIIMSQVSLSKRISLSSQEQHILILKRSKIVLIILSFDFQRLLTLERLSVVTRGKVKE